MIEPKDASTCDERRVKNKLNLLTHKKEGETHTMSIQGMKSWKTGLFFVISLIVVLGLFADTVSAQTATVNVTTSNVTTSPRGVVKAGEIIDVAVMYTLMGAPLDENDITVTLPIGTNVTGAWAAAYENFGDFNGTGAIDLDVETTPATAPVRMVSSLEARESPRSTSYVTVDYSSAGSSAYGAIVSISGSTVTITKDMEDNDPATPDVMAVGDVVVVTFHNVRVGALTTVTQERTLVPVQLSVIDEISRLRLLCQYNDIGDPSIIQFCLSIATFEAARSHSQRGC